MQKAVIYARYSSDTQTEQSIEGQLRVCKEYAQRNNLLVVETYIDRAMTGTNDMRPAFQRMIKDSYKHCFEVVLVYKLDRFSRDKYDSAIHKRTLKLNGAKVVSATEFIPDTPEGLIFESMIEGYAAYYSMELSQKVKRGLNESYIKGNYTGGYVMYGYKVENKKYVVEENEAKVIREIFAKYSQGSTAESIAKDLKEMGIRDKNGKYFKTAKLYKILENSKYNGMAVHNGKSYTNIFPKIVDDATWQRVCEIHESNKHAPSRKKEIYDFILSGKLVCGDCKRYMVGESGTSHTGEKHYYYTCLSRRRDKAHCELKSVSKQYLEDLVVNTTFTLLSDENTVNEIAHKLYEIHEMESKENSTLKQLEKQRTSALNASRNLISALEQGIVTEQTKERLKELEIEICQLDSDIDKEKNRCYTYLSEEDIAEYLHTVICGDTNDIKVRKTIINTFVREILLYNDRVVISYNFSELTGKHRIDRNEMEETERQANTAFSSAQSSYILPCLPPLAPNLNPSGSSRVLFLCSGLFNSSSSSLSSFIFVGTSGEVL